MATPHHGDTARWRGVFPAVPTPFDADGTVNEAAYRAVLEDNIAHGVHGFWNAGGTGEGGIMNDEQRTTVARITGEVCAGRVSSIMHVGSTTTASSVKAARAARDSGCDAICCVPPFFYRPSERSILEHYQRVADAADLPFFAYNLPQLTQVELLPPLMEKIQRAVPQLVGLKHSAPDFSQLRHFADMGLSAFVGDGFTMLPALEYGGVGVIDAPPAVAPWLYVALFDAFRSGDLDTARSLQAQTGPVTELTRLFDSSQHIAKIVLGIRTGIDLGAPLPPVNRLEPDEVATIRERAGALGLLEARTAV